MSITVAEVIASTEARIREVEAMPPYAPARQEVIDALRDNLASLVAMRDDPGETNIPEADEDPADTAATS